MDSKQSGQSIKIIDYGVLFEASIALILVVTSLPFLIDDIKSIISSGLHYDLVTLKVFAITILLFWLLYVFFIKHPKKIKNNKSYFLFTDNIIKYDHPRTDFTDGVNFTIPLNEIQNIDYCLVSELHNRYGRLHHLTSSQLYRKSSIGVHIGKATLFIYYSTIYIFLILPYRLWRLLKSSESTELLYQNLFITFKNRNYFVINIYSKDELDQIKKFFSKNNISIRGKRHFIPHLQNQGWFVDKNEKWTNNFNDENT